MVIPPSAELHLHIEGTLEPELVMSLAARNGVALPYADTSALRRAYDFDDLQSFLDLYYATMAVLIHREDFAEMTRAYLARAATGGVVHAEIMVDPQAHLARGVELEVAIGGIADVLATSETEFGVSTHLIAAFLRDRPEEEALTVLDALLAMGAPIVGIGLDSAELGHPPSKFRRLFERAAAAGLHRVAHAGEEGPPSYVREALDVLGAERIDHGIRSIEDPDLVARLARDRIPLTVCLLSNVALRAVDTLDDHPLPTMLDAGLLVCVNSDDPAYFGGYLDDNLRAVGEAFGFSPDQHATLAANSIRAAFLDDDRRRVLLDRVEAWRTAYPAGGRPEAD